jgi:hypothetical protein
MNLEAVNREVKREFEKEWAGKVSKTSLSPTNTRVRKKSLPASRNFSLKTT